MIPDGRSFVADFSHTPDPTEQFLDAVYRNGEGYMAMGFKHRRTGEWHDEIFEWPQDRRKVDREIARRVEAGWDVYACSNLMETADRRKGNAARVWVLSFELDAKAANPRLLHKLDAVRVASGTADHEHVYVLLAEPTDATTANRVTEAIAKAVSPHVGKWEDNALLRVPDTRNFKTDPPRAVRLRKPIGKRWSVDELETLIASHTPKKAPIKRRQGTRVSAARGMTQDQLRAIPGVQRALVQWGGTEEGMRNEAHLAVTRECYKVNAPQDAVVELVLSQAWCKGDETWVRDDIARIYAEAAKQGLPQVPSDEFWESRPILAHLRDYAAERLLPRWALLGHTLLRFAANIPPCYVLPDVVGDYGSLNLFVALVGPSGGGKTTSGAASKRAVPLPFEAIQAPVSTGQGIARSYMTPGRDSPIYHSDSVIFAVDEISKFRANLNRPDATLLGELNTAWAGGMLGAANADPTKRVILHGHTYRLGLHIGVQPGLADALLEHQESGFPQRFLWFESRLPMDAAEPTSRATSAWKWTPPGVEDRGIDFEREAEQFQVIGLPDFVIKDVRQDYIRRGQGLTDPLDSHRMLARLKVAAALMWMDGRSDAVNAEDWQLAGQIMAHSDLVRDQAHQYHVAQLAKRAEGAAMKAGQRAAISEEAKEAALIVKAKSRILHRLEGGEKRTRSDIISRGMTVSLRPVAETALDELKRAGSVKVWSTKHPKNDSRIHWCRLIEDRRVV